jgi:plasmid stabilization system protein ParE
VSCQIQMSVRRRDLDLTSDARHDLQDILNYSQREWGKQQGRTYKSNLDRASKQLVEFPYRGPARDDVSPGLRGLVVDAHIVSAC